jgi:prefoldin subunit 5
MKDRIENRLRALSAEYKAGQALLAELEARESNVRLTMARISGAIQALEELLNEESPADQPPASGSTSDAATAAA